MIERLGDGGLRLSLGRALSDADLARGVFVPARPPAGLLPPHGPGAASARAEGGTEVASSAAWPLAAAALVLLVTIGGGVVARRRRWFAPGVGIALGLVVLGIVGSGAPAETRAQTATGPAIPGDFYGIVSQDGFARSPAYLARTLPRQAALGIQLVRQPFHWSQIEIAPGRYDWRGYDRYVGQIAGHGLHLMPILFTPPRFRSSKPRRHAHRGTYPPRRPSDMAQFATLLVRRYGPDGTFWTAHPGVPKVPIRAWQVWNEPSLPAYWPAGPNPAAYTRLLVVTSRAIKAADPGAEVVTAGLPQSRVGIPFATFVRGMYRAGAKGSFDDLAIHPYARDAPGAVAAVASARRLMASYGDDSPIWVTELGWASDGPRSRFTVSAAGQSERLTGALRMLRSQRDELGLRGAVFYEWRDETPKKGKRDFWGFHTGLLRADGRAKPVLAALTRAIAEG